MSEWVSMNSFRWSIVFNMYTNVMTKTMKTKQRNQLIHIKIYYNNYFVVLTNTTYTVNHHYQKATKIEDIPNIKLNYAMNRKVNKW